MSLDSSALFRSIQPSISSLHRVDLLKALENHVNQFFKDFISNNYPAERHQKLINACISTGFEGVKEFSEEFYEILGLTSRKHQLMRDFIQFALEGGSTSGFSEFDTKLIIHAGKISSVYDKYYFAWLKAVQGNDVAQQLEKQAPEDKTLLNQYTIILMDSNKKYYDVPYAIHFKEELAPVLKAFDNCVEELSKIENLDSQQKVYIEYFRLYRNCLAEEDKTKVDGMWEQLDTIWMDIKYPIQIVHDIESGYGDPLRIKVIPDFSLRFVDETYQKANEKINEIQQVMVQWFSKRTGVFAKNGINALASSFAAIYYIPYLCGMSLHFRFSGQSIPNRSKVKDVKGVKIYFDPISTKNRQVQTGKLIHKVFPTDVANELEKKLEPIETLTYHVAAHEIGHAIYGLDHIKHVVRTSDTVSLLEEPRAELTALHTLSLLLESKMITENELQHHLLTFALQDLRRFSNFTQSTTRPYTISAINTYKVYEEKGYLKFQDSVLVLDESKAIDVISELSKQFCVVLDAEDALDGDKIENILKEMEKETPFIHNLVASMK